jgi:hypothetical protein
MFIGSIPADVRAIVVEHAGSWARPEVYVGCSGNFTVERSVATIGVGAVSNDVSSYTSALGWYLTGQPVPFRLRDEHNDAHPWLAGRLDDGPGTVATLMVGTRLFPSLLKTGAYHARTVLAYRQQWDRLIDGTAARLAKVELRPRAYHAMDVREYLAEVVPADEPFVCFPPFWAGGYEALYEAIDALFEWPRPLYPELDDDGKEALVREVASRPRWLLALHYRHPELEPFLRGRALTASGLVDIWLYAQSAAPVRYVRPTTPTVRVPWPKIPVGAVAEGPLRVHPMGAAQFVSLREQFLAKHVIRAAPDQCFAVSAGGWLVGAFTWRRAQDNPDEMFLLSDFAVPWSAHRRLSKLVVLAALSRETRTLIEARTGRQAIRWSTMAFSPRPNSSKYGRGIPGVRLEKREEQKTGVRYKLRYGGLLGTWDLGEAWRLWTARHADDRRQDREAAQ